MDSVQGLMNMNMVNNVSETEVVVVEERSTIQKVADALGSGGAIVQFICWLLGNATPAPIRHASRIAKGASYACKAYGVLKNVEIPSQENLRPFDDGLMSRRDCLGMNGSSYNGYNGYNPSFDASSIFRKEF